MSFLSNCQEHKNWSNSSVLLKFTAPNTNLIVGNPCQLLRFRGDSVLKSDHEILDGKEWWLGRTTAFLLSIVVSVWPRCVLLFVMLVPVKFKRMLQIQWHRFWNYGNSLIIGTNCQNCVVCVVCRRMALTSPNSQNEEVLENTVMHVNLTYRRFLRNINEGWLMAAWENSLLSINSWDILAKQSHWTTHLQNEPC